MKEKYLLNIYIGAFANGIITYLAGCSSTQTYGIGRFVKKLLLSVFLLLMMQGTAWGAIALRGSATSATTTNTTLTISKPTGVVAGDVMIVNITQTGNTTTNASLAGWTLIAGSIQSTGAPRYSTVLYKIATGSEGSSYSFALGSGASSAVGSIIAFSGVHPSVFDVAPGSFSTGGSTSVAATGITTVTDEAAIVFLAGAGGTDSDVYSAWSGTTPTFTEIMDFSYSNVTSSVGAAWGGVTTAGATGNQTVTVDGNYYWAGILIALKPAIDPLSSQTVTFTSSGSFTVPSCVTSLTVEAWGGGGSGGTRSTNGNGGGAGGGAYSKGSVSVVAGNTYTVNVGSGSTSTSAGGDTWFQSNATLMAKGGGSVANNSAAGATGGQASAGVGSTKFNGGNGANGAGSYGGGGGSSAGTMANGNNGSGATGGAARPGGGDGGDGRAGSQGNGSSGTILPGGGGGGGYRTSSGTRNGGNGNNGQIIITYTLPNNPTITLSSSTASTDYSVSAQDATFAYSASTGCPDKYSIDFASGITDITDANLLGSPITIALPAGLAVGAYTGTLTVSNSTYGFVSNSTPITVTVTQPAAPTTITETFSTSGTFIVPNCVTSLTVEAWGGGGGGFNGSNSGGGKGGGGGGYAKGTITDPASSYSVVVGSGGGENSNGSASTFGSTLVVADYGRGGTNATTAGGAGGTANTGNITTSNGGNGGNGNTTGDGGGGGGGAGGKDGNGSNGVNAPNNVGGAGGSGNYGSGGAGGAGGNGSNGASGQDNILGGGGGGGGDNATIGGAGGFPGAGGGGGENGGGTGANGQVKITYTLPTAPTIILTNNSVSTDFSPSAQNVTFGYSASTGCPDTYSINVGPDPFITDANLTAGPITVTLPAGLAVGTYNATLTVKNSSNGFVSQGYNISVIVKELVPTIIASPTTLNGFTYAEGNGPSQILSFSVQGTTLNSNINLYPTTSFEISRTAGGGFTAESPLVLNAVSGAVATTTVYVRMKAGLAQGTVAPEFIEATAISADTVKISVSGDVTVKPLLTVGSISTNFTYQFGQGPSNPQSFTLSGTNLQGDVVITAPTDFEVSTSNNSGFSSSITLPGGGGTWNLTSRPIYVRLKENLGVGTRTQDVQVSSTAALTKTVSATGIVTSTPTILNPVSLMGAFLYQQGSGPSGSQSFPVSGYNLGARITIAAPTHYELSLSSGSGFTNSLTLDTLDQIGGIVNETLIYVRLKSGLTAGDLDIESIVLTSDGATTKSIGLRGVVSTITTPTIAVSKSSLTGFGYQAAQGGPSPVQSFVVSGAALTANIVLTAPANYEISTSSGSGFGSTHTIIRTGNKVDPTIIYMRLIASKPAGDYKGVNLTATSSGATQKNISIAGKVFTSPLIQAGGGGGHCIGSPINLTSTDPDGSIQNLYWEGPYSFYSTDKNPVIPTAAINDSGDYTVTANVIIGGNLVTNGDFELGNTSFGSAYEYPPLPLSQQSLQPEGRYAVVDLPSEVHNNFSPTASDHTPSPGTKQMVINGNVTPGAVIWSQTVNVVQSSDYEFTYWLQTVVNGNDANPSKLQLYVNGVAAGPVYTANSTTGVWERFIYNTKSGTNLILNLELVNQNIIAGGNDFALDDIVFQQILTATSTTNVMVNTALPVSVIVVASSDDVTQGSTVTYTATPTNGGASPSYQWKVNGVNAGSNSSTFSYVPVQGDKVTCVLTSSLLCTIGDPATSNTITMTVNPATNYWRGTNSTDWGTTSNWTANKVPLAGDNVVYATAANYGSVAVRDLVLDQHRTIGSLINLTDKRLVIPAGKYLTVNNTITVTPPVQAPPIDRANLIYIYSSSTLPNGSLSFKNAQDNPVYATVEMYSKANYDEEQPVNHKYQWQFFGIPLRSVKAEPTFYGSVVRRQIEAGTTISNHWVPLTNDSVLKPFVGYEITHSSPKTLYFSGALVNADFDSGQLPITVGALYPGQHLFTNPYTAAMDIRQVELGSGTDGTLYLYHTGTFAQWQSQTEEGSNPGQYIAVPKNLAGAGGLPLQIPSMGSFVVIAESGSVDDYIKISYNAVVMKNNDMLRIKSNLMNEEEGPGEVKPVICTSIELQGDRGNDKLWIFSDDAYTRGYDRGSDGTKIMSPDALLQIFAIEGDLHLQVNAVNDIHNTYLGFKRGKGTSFKLIFHHENIELRYDKIYLLDLVANKLTDVTKNGSSYVFEATSTFEPVSRFRILTKPIDEDSSDLSLMRVFSYNNTLYAENLSEHDGDFYVYDLSGRRIGHKVVAKGGVAAISISDQTVCIAKIVTSLETITRSVVIK